MRWSPGGAPSVLFLRTRRAGWALVTSFVLTVGLLTSEREVAVPLFGTTTTTVFVWPLLATVPTALVLSPTTQEWDLRGRRPVRLLHAAVVTGVVSTSAVALVILRPPGWTSALATYLGLQAATITSTRVLGDWAWMPTVAVGSLAVVNSPFVTDTVAAYTDRHWRPLGAAATAVSLVALLAPPTNGRDTARFALGGRRPRAQ